MMRYNVTEDKYSKVSRALGCEPRPEWLLNLACDCERHECTVDGVAVKARLHPIHGLIATL